MDDERSRDFWERALQDIRDDGFFASVQTVEPPQPPVAQSFPSAPRRHVAGFHLVLLVLAVAIVLALIVIDWLAPALF